MGGEEPLCFLTARELAELLARGEVSAREVMEAHLRRVERLDRHLHAFVTLAPEQALETASRLDHRFPREGPVGPLHGVPVAHKDLLETAGLRTTFGSPLFADYVPAADAPLVARLRAAGAVTLGKTNTPEFGAGSHTFNRLLPPTRNPWDPNRSAGGSSGGAAAALAARLVPLADGSDMGGSLRNPASFCNVVGLRPTPGLVPDRPALPWNPLSVLGPMGRTVADVALFFGAMLAEGPSPLSTAADPAPFLAFDPGRPEPLRIGWSPDLGGLPVDRRVLAVLGEAVRVFESLGCLVEEVTLELEAADEVFHVFRALTLEAQYGRLLDEHPDAFKPALAWNIRAARELDGPRVAAAWRSWGELLERVRSFFERYDLLACPAAQVPPFPIGLEYPLVIAQRPMRTYIEWMRVCSRITVFGTPAISVPAGFTDEGLPVGLQIVAPRRQELRLLRAAAWFEEATGYWRRVPDIAV